MVRIGMVNYINTAPIYEVLKETIFPETWEIVEGHPNVLNELLAASKIDMGFVSLLEYGLHPDQYRILADLSISATGPVGSVTLFSTLDPEKLDHKKILLTGQSATSVSLVKVILEEFYNITPEYDVGDIYTANAKKDFDAVLAIGDDALRLGLENRYPVKLDLSEVWFERTGLPFVFSVCAVRESFIIDQAQTTSDIRELLINCRVKGQQQMSSICKRVADRIPMDCSLCTEYLNGIEHDLSAEKLKGLERFFKLLIKRKDIPANALPLKIFR